MEDIKLEELSDKEIATLLRMSISEYMKRGINNLIGELGETWVINYFRKSKKLPELKKLDDESSGANTPLIDANGKKYLVKTIDRFMDVKYKAQGIDDEDAFDTLLIVRLSKDFELEVIYELSKEKFLDYKNWYESLESKSSIREKLDGDNEVVKMYN